MKKLLSRTEIAERIGNIVSADTIARHIRDLGIQASGFRPSPAGRGRPQPLYTLDNVADIKKSVKASQVRKNGGARARNKAVTEAVSTASVFGAPFQGFGGSL